MAIFLGISLALVFIGVFSSSYGNVLPVPPKDITTKHLRKYLSLQHIDIDVPALYVFGDAFVDAGNNNFLKFDKNDTLKHVNVHFNFPPYGIDYIGGECTGRATNGRNVVDFIAQVIGVPCPPPVLGMSKVDVQKTLSGVSYASGASGILAATADILSIMGDVLTFDEQIDLFEFTTQRALKVHFNSTKRYYKYLSKSLFFINEGSQDLAAEWDVNYSKRPNSTFNNYAKMLSKEFSKKLERLYYLGARKFIVNNIAPLACNPDQHKSTLVASCLEYDKNKEISTYNKLLSDLVKQLQSKLKSSEFILGDLHSIYRDVIVSPTSYGFTNITSPCCETKPWKPCVENSVPCKDRNSYLYYDNWHPTESMHYLWARRLLRDSSVCSPTTLSQLM